MSLTNKLNSPILTVVASICSILGLGTGFYFYKESIRVPELSYHVSPVRSTIVKSGGASELTASFGGQTINDDISTAQITVWNAGKLPIRSDDILTPIQLKVGNNQKILESHLIKSGRQAALIKLDPTQENNGLLGLGWQILEHNDGCVIQIIYAGRIDTNIQLIGDIVDQRKITEVKFSGEIKSAEEQYKPKKSSLWVLFGDLISKLLLSYYFLFYIRAQVAEAEDKYHLLFLKIFKWTFLGVNVLLIALNIYVYFSGPQTLTPFG